MQGLRLRFKPLALQDLTQLLLDGLRGHGPQIELQAPRQNSDRHLLRIGRGQDKFQILGGFLQSLEHRIERGAREHVDLIDHEDLKAPLHRFVNRLLQELLHFVHTAVRRCVKFGVIHKAARINGQAHLT